LRLDAKYMADTKIADSKRQFEMQKAAFDMEVNARVSTGKSYNYKTCNLFLDTQQQCDNNYNL
jgi:flotillin